LFKINNLYTTHTQDFFFFLFLICFHTEPCVFSQHNSRRRGGPAYEFKWLGFQHQDRALLVRPARTLGL
jgi:hypothetical protein